MGFTLNTIIFLALAGFILFACVLLLRFVLKFAWKIIRVVLVLISVFLVAGFLLGFLDNIFW